MTSYCRLAICIREVELLKQGNDMPACHKSIFGISANGTFNVVCRASWDAKDFGQRSTKI